MNALLTRREFLQSGGAVVIGLALPVFTRYRRPADHYPGASLPAAAPAKA